MRKPQTLDDPHIQMMKFFQPLDFPGIACPAPVAKAPVWLTQTPSSIRQRAPVLGEYTNDILRELGYDPVAIAKLREMGIVYVILSCFFPTRSP